MKNDKENAQEAKASKARTAELDKQIKKIEELKESLAENRAIQVELKATAEAEKAAKLKVEDEKRALDVTKTEFVQNALKYAIMRGRAAKVIEQQKEEQKKLESSISESTSEIQSLKEAERAS